MISTPSASAGSVTSRVFRAAVRLLPAAFPRRDAAELCAIYDQLDAEARRSPGRCGGALTLGRELPGLGRLIVRERTADWRARRVRRRQQRMVASYQVPYSEDTSMIESFVQDVRYAVRALRKSASYVVISVATLALGIGANTAIFSVVNGVLLRPLAVRDPDRIVTVMSYAPTQPPSIYGSSPANFNDLRRDTRSASNFAAFTTTLATVIGSGEPESFQAVTTVGDIFGVLGVRPLFGRTLTPNDDSPAAAAAVVLSYDTWQRLYGEDRSAIGKTITIDRKPRVIVGVMPPGFRFAAAQADLWVPEQWSPEYAANRDQYYLQIIARLAPGKTVDRLSSELETVATRLRTDHAEYNTNLHLSATSLQETIVSDVRPRLLMLMGAVGFLLLITCVNLANLTLARASSRHGEFAVRRALGAARGRVASQLLTESLLLATAGGLAGLAVGSGLLRLIIAAERTSLPRVDEISLDPIALAFTIGVSLLAGIAVGILPAVRASTASSMEVLRQGLRGSGTHQRARSALVVVELAVALMLLTGAGLLLRSFGRLLDVKTGFSTERLLTLRMTVGAKSVQAVEESLDRLRAIPGVRAASVTSQLPVTGRGGGAWLNLIERPTPPNETPPGEAYRVVAPDYFSTAGIRLVRGRFPTLDDRADGASAVVVNEALAKKYWPNENAIGKQIVLGAPGNYLMPPSPIVGIVGDTPDAGLDSPPIPIVFLPMRVVPWWPVFTYVIRTAGPPEAVIPAVRRELRARFPTIAIRNVQDDGVGAARIGARRRGCRCDSSARSRSSRSSRRRSGCSVCCRSSSRSARASWGSAWRLVPRPATCGGW